MGPALAVVVANITDHTAQGLVQIGGLPPGAAFELEDRLADRTYTWSRDDLGNGLYARLASGDAHLFLWRAL
jgi:hypothetical protein